MLKHALNSKFTVVLCLFLIGTSNPTIADIGDATSHTYFDNLVSRSDHWKSYSLRDKAQLSYPNEGGFAHSNNRFIGLWVTYDRENDGDAHRQDAAKVTIPAFAHLSSENILSESISASTTTITLVRTGSNFVFDRSIKMDDEIATIVSVQGNTLTVKRGMHGTMAAAHSAGTAVKISANSLLNQVRLPLGTSDGHTYFFTWEGYWTDSYLGTNTHSHKTFQFSSGGDSIWHEPRTRYEGGSLHFRAPGFDPNIHISSIDVRSYQQPCIEIGVSCTDWSLTNGNVRGSGTVGTQPMAPMKGHFIIKPNTWTRFFVRLIQRANDWDEFDLWIADETTEAVHVYDSIPVSVRPKTNAVDRFWLEFNSSQVRHVRGNERDWVSYVRNFVVLRDPVEIESLLLRPAPGVPLPPLPSVPTAPKNFRLAP